MTDDSHSNADDGGVRHGAASPADEGPGEGVIRFAYRMTPPAPSPAAPLELFRAAHRRGRALGLLGRDPARYDGLAYGNLSLRTAEGFWVTASQRIDAAQLEAEDLVLVTAIVRGGEVLCRGTRPPSSETLTHAAVQTHAGAGPLAVFHGHAPALWKMPPLAWSSTPPEAANGTRAMAEAVGAAVRTAPRRGCLVMLGHEDGILAWSDDFDSILDALAVALEARGALPADA